MTKQKTNLEPTNSPQPIGAYSQSVDIGNLVFLSGQIGLDPKTGGLVGGGIKDQTDQVMRNIIALLQDCALDLENVVKSEVFLADLTQFQAFNKAYSLWFDDDQYPARSTVGVAALPMQALVEIACTAVR